MRQTFPYSNYRNCKISQLQTFCVIYFTSKFDLNGVVGNKLQCRICRHCKYSGTMGPNHGISISALGICLLLRSGRVWIGRLEGLPRRVECSPISLPFSQTIAPNRNARTPFVKRTIISYLIPLRKFVLKEK